MFAYSGSVYVEMENTARTECRTHNQTALLASRRRLWSAEDVEESRRVREGGKSVLSPCLLVQVTSKESAPTLVKIEHCSYRVIAPAVVSLQATSGMDSMLPGSVLPHRPLRPIER